ncbi:insulin gene enhancer protein ISL-1-like isoform X1 [Dendronephthya gigantea]|uniref:insulin gene enhancer protein ISL-1-like isoform X1 n=1 Tax=Dendronephthya gigantea TaxID=151771 RepID=UPI00106B0A2D|nr:insulin gene enhancer protein ISL-1-like isoform X1 [Dendronephthya gigantea]
MRQYPCIAKLYTLNYTSQSWRSAGKLLSQYLQVSKMNSGALQNPSRRIALCVGCGAQITDQFILRVSPDLEWHATCLKCSECNVALDESSTCFVREGKTYCKRDYYRLFGSKCAKCNQGFNKKDYVMRVKNKIFHMECFRCVACSKQLLRGEEFALRDNGLFCKADHIILEKAREHYSAENLPASMNTGRPTYQIRHEANSKKVEKTTRVRTVLNEKQLHTLRTCYAANPRPDAMMKEQLVEMTGLSPRVIRVWFQNKRCKDKKKSIQMKQQGSRAVSSPEDQSSCSLTDGSSISLQQSLQDRNSMAHGLVASSPDSDPGYQPWKALNEFAMQSEIERTPFEQLVNFSEQNPNVTSLLSNTT